MKYPIALLLLACSLCGTAGAQGSAATPVASGQLAAAAPAPAAPTVAGVQSQSIFEVKPAASEDPGYMEQTNGERARVQPGNNAPMWRSVGAGVTGFSSLPHSQAPEAGNLIQPFAQYPGSKYVTAGEAWRQTRNKIIIPYGGALIFITLLAVALFYFTKGPLKVVAPPTGKKIERFTYFERAAHWSNATAFSILAISGIVMAFGKFFLLPILGGAVFGWITWLLKTAHNFVGPLFVVAEWAFTLGLRKEVQAAVEARSGPVRLRTGQQAAAHPQ